MKENSKVAQEARQAVERWRKYFNDNIQKYHFMHEFVLRTQWNEEESSALIKNKKRPMQFNKLSTLVNTLLGEQQQNTPQIEINPMSDCEAETAIIRQALTKDIMLGSDAKKVYQIAASQAFVGGFGAYFIDIDYVHERSFDTVPVYRHLKDATMAYWDVGAKDSSKTDGMRAGFIERVSRKKFQAEYGKEAYKKLGGKKKAIAATTEEVALITNSTGVSGNFEFVWQDEETIVLIYDFERTYIDDTLYLLSNGDVLTEDELAEARQYTAKTNLAIANKASQEFEASEEDIAQAFYDEPDSELGDMGATEDMLAGNLEEAEAAESFELDPDYLAIEEDINELIINGHEVVTIEESRKIKRSKIIQRVIAGDMILDESEFPSDDLPVIFVDQNSHFDEHGKQYCRAFVEDAIDAQRYINYIGTHSAYLLKTYRYDQFIGSRKNAQSNDTAAIWRDPSNHQGLLIYDESPSGAKPEQLRPPELPISLTQQYERAVQDLYTSTGLYPTRLGDQGNETSGKAIDARTRQGSYSTYVAFNSINNAITAGGKVLNQMIPRVYNNQRTISLMTPNEGRQSIVINEQVGEYGALIKNNLRRGTYEVVLQAGPSYEGQKSQALESLNQVILTNPSLFNLFADLYAENLPLMNTLEIKNRLKTIVPPEIVEAGKTGEMPQQAQRPNPADQAMMAQVEIKQQELEIKKQELQLEIERAQKEMEIKEMEMQIRRLEAAAELEEQKLRYAAETDRTRSDNQISHANNITKLLISNNKINEKGDKK